MMAKRGFHSRTWSVALSFLLAAGYTAASAEEPQPGMLLRRSPWVQFEVVSGRIAVANLSRAPNRTLTSETEAATESLTLNASGEETGFQYRYKSTNREWILEYRASGQLTITDTNGKQEVRLEQHSERSIQLTLQQPGEEKKSFAAPSLWHFLLFDPTASEVLEPQLTLLDRTWDLKRQSSEIAEELFQNIGTNWYDERSAWQRELRNLASPNYQVRQVAEQKLRTSGAGCTGYLTSLDLATLSAEQRRRVTGILETASQQRDTPSEVAEAWVYNADLWCRWLDSGDTERRTAAAEHLAKLLGRPTKFNPTDNPQERAAQIQTIRATLLR